MKQLSHYLKTLHILHDACKEASEKKYDYAHEWNGSNRREKRTNYLNAVNGFVDYLTSIINDVNSNSVANVTINEIAELEHLRNDVYSLASSNCGDVKEVIDELIDALIFHDLIDTKEYMQSGRSLLTSKLLNNGGDISDEMIIQMIRHDGVLIKTVNQLSSNPMKYLNLLLDASEVELLGSVFSKIDFDDATNIYLLAELKNRKLLKRFIENLTLVGKDKLMLIVVSQLFEKE